MNIYPDYEIVQKCLHQIEEQLGWGSSKDWHNEMFLELSEKIQEQTNVRLSPTTLKRIWGKVNYSNAPSINTLNTLAQFAEFKNWRDFKLNIASQKSNTFSKKVIPNIRIILILASLMTLIFISFFSMVGSNQTTFDTSAIKDVQFSSQPVTQGLPNSVVFDLDLKGIESDSILIQQYWDKTKTVKIKKDQKQATAIYYTPGHFRAKLLVDGQIIKEHNLFIKSNDWLGMIDYKPIPKYIHHSDLKNKNLSFPKTIFEEIKSNETPLTASFHFVDDFQGTSGDNFTLNTSIKNSYQDKWAVCQNVRIVILGTTGAMVVPFSIPGCVSDLYLMLNDFYMNGKENDLSAFGFDFSESRDISIEVENQEVTISVDLKEIFTGSYDESIGDFVGIRYRFLGAVEIEHLSVANQEGKVVLSL